MIETFQDLHFGQSIDIGRQMWFATKNEWFNQTVLIKLFEFTSELVLTKRMLRTEMHSTCKKSTPMNGQKVRSIINEQVYNVKVTRFALYSGHLQSISSALLFFLVITFLVFKRIIFSLLHRRLVSLMWSLRVSFAGFFSFLNLARDDAKKIENVLNFWQRPKEPHAFSDLSLLLFTTGLAHSLRVKSTFLPLITHQVIGSRTNF